MIGKEQVTSLVGATAYTQDGQRVGQVGQIFFDDRSGAPAWATIATGLFGARESFVPLEGAQFDGRDLHVAVDQDMVTHAPNIDPEGKLLTEDEERELYRFYHVDFGPRDDLPGPASEEGFTASSASGEAPTGEAATAYPRAEATEYERAAARSGEAITASYAGEAAAYGHEAATSGTGTAPDRTDAETMARLDDEGAAGERRFRTRLRRYLTDPELATRPVAEQAEIEDSAVAAQETGTDPRT